MGNQMIMLLVVGGLLGLFGGNAISKLNPFKARRVVVVKQEMQREEYFKDKVKGIEYRITERSKGQTPVKQKKTIGSFIDNSFQAIIKLTIVMFIGSLLLGVNLFKYIRRLKTLTLNAMKGLKQTVKAIEIAKPKLNGEEKVLKEQLARNQDEDTKLLIDKIKHGQE